LSPYIQDVCPPQGHGGHGGHMGGGGGINLQTSTEAKLGQGVKVQGYRKETSLQTCHRTLSFAQIQKYVKRGNLIFQFQGPF
jgi:hypothetical protein